jgi:hypothetical protein
LITQTFLLLATSLTGLSGQGSPLRVTFSEAQFSTRLVSDSGWALPPRGRKLLQVRFVVSNPASYPVEYTSETVRVFVVKPANGEVRVDGGASPLQVGGYKSQTIAPGGNIKAEAVLEVPNADVAPKIRFHIDERQTEISLAGKVKPARGPLATTGGMVTVDDLEGKVGDRLPLGPWDVSVAKPVYTTASPTPALTVEKGQSMLLISLTAQNALKEGQTFDAASVNPELALEDGTTVVWPRIMLQPDRPDFAAATVRGGGKATGRLAWTIPAASKPKTLKLIDPTTERTVLIRF